MSCTTKILVIIVTGNCKCHEKPEINNAQHIPTWRQVQVNTRTFSFASHWLRERRPFSELRISLTCTDIHCHSPKSKALPSPPGSLGARTPAGPFLAVECTGARGENSPGERSSLSERTVNKIPTL